MVLPMQVPDIPDELTFRAVECRILRACKTIRALPAKDTKFLHRSMQNSIWREAVSEWDAYGSEEVRVRFQPTAYDCGDVLTALAWVNVLHKREFKLIWWRSFDNVSFAIIAGRLGRHEDTAKRRYETAVGEAWHEALREAGLIERRKPGVSKWAIWGRR